MGVSDFAKTADSQLAVWQAEVEDTQSTFRFQPRQNKVLWARNRHIQA